MWGAVFVWILCWHLNRLLLISGTCGTRNTLLLTSQFRGISPSFASINDVFSLSGCIILDEILHKRGGRDLVQLLPTRGRSPGWVVTTKVAVPSGDLGTEHSTRSPLSLPSQPTSSKCLLSSGHSLFPIFWEKIAQSWPSLDLGSWYPALPVLGVGFLQCGRVWCCWNAFYSSINIWFI